MRIIVALVLVLWPSCTIAGDPPTPITCNDPSFKAGGNLLGGYVTPNELSTDIVFEASSMQYRYNESVHFRVSAPKTGPPPCHLQAPVYLALQVTFTGADGEAQGHFHDLTPGLEKTPNCASSIFTPSGNPFNGTESMLFSWSPSDHGWETPGLRLSTIGNATFSLLWANAPTGGQANPYVYMKSLSLWDPKKWNPLDPPAPPPAPPPKTDACVIPTHPDWEGYSHSYKGKLISSE